MKEATGELNMTVITMVAIAAAAALFYAFVWPNIQNSLQAHSVCSNGAGFSTGTANTKGYIKCGKATGGVFECEHSPKNGQTVKVTCSQK